MLHSAKIPYAETKIYFTKKFNAQARLKSMEPCRVNRSPLSKLSSDFEPEKYWYTSNRFCRFLSQKCEPEDNTFLYFCYNEKLLSDIFC